MELIDIGANLGHESFQHDFADVLARARDAGVIHMVVTGASREGSREALRLAQEHPDLLSATAGVHPHHALEVTEEGMAELRALHALPEIVAVGECGLDYFRDFSPRPVQVQWFREQVALANQSLLVEQDPIASGPGDLRFDEVLSTVGEDLASHHGPVGARSDQCIVRHTSERAQRGQVADGFEEVRLPLAVLAQDRGQTGRKGDLGASVGAEVAQPELLQLHVTPPASAGGFRSGHPHRHEQVQEVVAFGAAQPASPITPEPRPCMAKAKSARPL